MSNKIVLGLVLGGVLGILDGLTAWFTPAVRAGIVGIVIGSMIKGLIAGVLIGIFARKVTRLPWASCSGWPWVRFWPGSSLSCSMAITSRSCFPVRWLA